MEIAKPRIDFGLYTMDDIAGKWAQAGKPEDARALIKLHAETHSESSHMETVLGEIEQACQQDLQ